MLHIHMLHIPSVDTYTQSRPLGGRILSAMATVDTMSLHQLVSRGVRPEVVGCLHLRVLQCTRSNCHNEVALLRHQCKISPRSVQLLY